MRHTDSEVGDASICLLGNSQIALWYQDVAHRQHAETTKFLWRVKHYWWEATRHFRVQTNLDPRLDLVLAFDKQIEQFFSVDDGFSEVSHQAD